jgi:hypothetical protein
MAIRNPGSFGESLGIPTGIPQGMWGIGPAALGLPSSDSCEFGVCGAGSTGFVAAAAAPEVICVFVEPCGAVVAGTVAVAAAGILAYEI